MLNLILITLKILQALIAADLFTGLIHFIEDNYFSSETWLIGSYIIQPNRIHHVHPKHITNKTYIENIKLSSICSSIFYIFWYIIYGHGSLFLISFLFFVSISNLIHRWSHEHNNHFLIYMLQYTILINNQQHQLHHLNIKTNYCIMTPFCNPILEHFNVWRQIERLINYITSLNQSRLHNCHGL